MSSVFPAVSVSERPTIAMSEDCNVIAVDESVMMPAQHDEVIDVRISAVLPMNGVVYLR